MKRTTQNVIVGTFITAILVGSCAILNIQSNQQSNLSRPGSSTQTENQEKPIDHTDSEKTIAKPEPVVETKTETSTKPIPYSTKYVDDNSLPKDQIKTTTHGVDGAETTTYEVTYTDGVETSRKVINIITTKQPVTEVISRGTYVAPKTQPATSCPNGTYVNSAGNTVCRPTSSPSRPAGATARCRDGSYSYSQSRRGTCSHHGGVSAWL